MSYADKIMAEIDSAKSDAPAQQEAVAEETKPVEETPAETTDAEQPAETPKEPDPEKTEDKPEDKPAEEKPFSEQRSEWLDGKDKDKKDPSQFSKEEQAEYAFRRQLARQKAKYEQGLEDIKKSFKADLDEIKQSLKPKEATKTREDFPLDKGGDDEYIRYLTDQKVNEIMSARDAEAAKRAEQEKADAEAHEAQMQVAKNFTDNAKKCFDETQYKVFDNKVRLASENGLAEMLDEVPNVRDYLFTSPDGPLVLNEMLSSKDAFLQIMSRAHNPIESTIELHEMAKSIRGRGAAPAPAQPKPMPNIGKPGSTRGPSAPTMWDNDKALIDFVRKHR